MTSTRGCLCVFAVSVLVAALAVWLAARSPILIQHLPAHERCLQHAALLVFRGLIHGACSFARVFKWLGIVKKHSCAKWKNYLFLYKICLIHKYWIYYTLYCTIFLCTRNYVLSRYINKSNIWNKSTRRYCMLFNSVRISERSLWLRLFALCTADVKLYGYATNSRSTSKGVIFWKLYQLKFSSIVVLAQFFCKINVQIDWFSFM